MTDKPPSTISFAYATPDEAVAAWMKRINPISNTQTIPLAEATGRVLARDLHSDRPSPPCSVSAMDGYVFRIGELRAGTMEVAGEVLIGQAPPEDPTGCTKRIYTGSPVPNNCDRIIKREDVEEHDTHIIIPTEVVEATPTGCNIRYEGENMQADQLVIHAGKMITMPIAASLAGFGNPAVEVYNKVRITILTTGDEIRAVEDKHIDPWQIRNSNGPALSALFSSIAWLQLVRMDRVRDDFKATCQQLKQAFAESNAVILSGGVSMGDHDYIPQAVREVGGEVVFHKLPVKPGKPILAAVGPQGQVIAGLPGNPVSVMVSAVRSALPALRKKAGFLNPTPAQPVVTLTEPLQKTLKLWWFRPVILQSEGHAKIVPTKGSGDFGSLAQSAGFIQIPPNRNDTGPYPYWSWHQY